LAQGVQFVWSMNIGLYVGAAAMSALDRWQDLITQNIASTDTPGFQKRAIVFSTQPAGLVPAGVGGRGATMPGQYPMSSVGVTFTSGQLVPTSRELDVAIQGDGFFQVQLANGEHGYTRAGGFYPNAERALVDSKGNPVLGEGGAAIQLLAEGGTVTIAHDGTITQGGQPIGKLTVYKFDDPHQLKPVSGALFV
jgi:flagellar basal-body rod protein FlgF